jgi:hypothetical protein
MSNLTQLRSTVVNVGSQEMAAKQFVCALTDRGLNPHGMKNKTTQGFSRRTQNNEPYLSLLQSKGQNAWSGDYTAPINLNIVHVNVKGIEELTIGRCTKT